MTARLRVLPVFCAREGEPSHYLVLDPGEGGQWPEDQWEGLAEAARSLSEGRVPAMVFEFPVDLPDVTVVDGGDE